MSTAGDEIQLLENVELRLALSETDAQLEKNVGLFLTPVLLKLSSPHENVRNKVMQVLGHINKRVRPNTNIQLPFSSLLMQYNDPKTLFIVKNFDILYLEMGFSRLKVEDMMDHVPALLRDIAARPATQRTTIMHMIIPMLDRYKLKPDQEVNARSRIFHFDSNPADLAYILRFFLRMILYSPVSGSMSKQEREEKGASGTGPPFGLSLADADELTNNNKKLWTSDLVTAKLGILKFLLTSVFTDNERFEILLAGTVDSNHQVVTTSEDGLRRWTTKADLEDSTLVQHLYSLYLGTPSNSKVDAKARRRYASNPLKIRILQSLAKSKTAANSVVNVLQTVFDGLFGEESSSKLKQQSMAYLQWVAKSADSSKLATVAPIMLSGLLKYIRENDNVSGNESESTKGYAYVACGLIASKVPETARKDTAVLRLFFDSLSTEPPNVRTYVQDALSSIMVIYKDPEEGSELDQTLREIILENILTSNPSSRYIALKYANSIYPFSNVYARYICLLGHSSTVTKLEVREEASRGLRPFSHDKDFYSSSRVAAFQPDVFPSFASMVQYISGNKPSEEYIRASRTPIVWNGYPVEVFVEILKFLRILAMVEANGQTMIIDDDIEQKVADGISEDPNMRRTLSEQLRRWWQADENSTERTSLNQWLTLVEKGLSSSIDDAILHSVASESLLELISLGPSTLSSAFTSKIDFFKSFVFSPKQETRECMSHIFGLIGSESNVPDDVVRQNIEQFIQTAKKPVITSGHTEFDQKHGALLALGHLVGRCLYRGRNIHEDLLKQVINVLVDQLEITQTAANASLISASCHSIGEIGHFRQLPYPASNYTTDNKQKGKEIDGAADNMEIDVTTQLSIIRQLASLAKNAKDNKVQEQATQCLGQLSIFVTDAAALDEIITAFYETANTKQVDLYFASGDALSVLAYGWNSEAMSKCKDIVDAKVPDDPKSTGDGALFEKILETIFTTYVVSDKATRRKAASIWLLCLIKFCQSSSIIQKNLHRLHAGFSRLLSDRDDFTQEVASKGLGLVYETGDSKMKEDLLYSLVGTFTEGKKIQAQSMTPGTVLFEQGALGSTPEGGSITTYKELCSLASEMNQPDLIYKFMNLANHNAMWTSRRGAAFGFQSIIALSEKELQHYLPKLIPKLYRYQFDPNPNVNASMKMIWTALVKDSKKTVDQYFNQIMEELLNEMGSPTWRTRESSCLAITDLLQGRQLSQVEPYLERLWQMAFRAIDDIKESVRQAATATCRSLARLTVYYCDASRVSPSDGAKIMRIVMPFLLENGIVSDAEDVRKFSLDTILKICKTAGNLLKPHIPDIVDTLLQSLSSMEPQVMNYLTFHADKYNVSEEQLDNARLSGAKNSPMMEGVEHCVEYIDDETMNHLSPRLLNIVRKGTGLPTKAGCARFIVALCLSKRHAFQPHADNTLKALSGAIQDRNAAVRKTYATAVGYVAGLASVSRSTAFVKHLAKIYFGNDDDDVRSAAGITMSEMMKHATDMMKSLSAEVVPLTYFGVHDPNDKINASWKEAWDTLTNGECLGTTGPILLYMTEILELVRPHLSSQSWTIKQAAALTVADMCKSTGPKMSDHMDSIMPIMLSSLSSRSWAGKEIVLDAFVRLCIACKDWWRKDGAREPTLKEIAEILIREAKRNNKDYKRHAIVSMTRFLGVFNEDIDILDDVQEFLVEICVADENEMMDQDDDREKPLVLLIKANAFRALAASFRGDVFPSQQTHVGSLVDVLTKHILGNVWNVQLAIYESLGVLLSHLPSSMMDTNCRDAILGASWQGLNDLKYSANRTACINNLKTCLPKWKDAGLLDPATVTTIRQHLDNAIHKDPLPLIAAEAKTVRDTL